MNKTSSLLTEHAKPAIMTSKKEVSMKSLNFLFHNINSTV